VITTSLSHGMVPEKARHEAPGTFRVTVDPIHNVVSESRLKGPLRVGIYCRCAVKSQHSDHPTERQITLCEERIKTEPTWTRVATYIDDGFGGLREDRPGLLQLLADVEASKLDIVLTPNLSRISRDPVQLARIYRRLAYRRVQLVVLNDHDMYLTELFVRRVLREYRQRSHRTANRQVGGC
jgi:DNA invertase Pin-like site-specific DNA recombinase